MFPTLAVIGSTSMVGSSAYDFFSKSGISLIRGDLSGPEKLDITKKRKVKDFFAGNKFDWAVLFSAFTGVDKAEEQRGDKSAPCWKINVEGVKNVTDLCKKFNRKLIFFSTDFIFDGTNGPYEENDPPGPDIDKVSWYGITKIEAEKYIKKTLEPPHFIIIRISFPYSGRREGKEDLMVKVINLYKSHNLFPLYFDQTITPTFIPDVGPAILAILQNSLSGTFHLASPNLTTPYEFAKYAISKAVGKNVEIAKTSLSDLIKKKGATPRPLKAGLKTDKIKDIFKPTDWRQGIEKALGDKAQVN